MKTPTRFTVSLLAVAAAQASALAADDVPKPFAFARYEPMLKRSPFAISTAVAPPPQAPNFAKDLYIANAAKLAGEGVVTLNSNVDKNLKEYLSTKGPNKDGYSISNIEWSDRVGATKVTIMKDGQFATLTFNQALLSQASANPGQPAPPQPQPQMQPQITNGLPGTNAIPTPITTLPPNGAVSPSTVPVNGIRPAPIPTLPTPPPRVRGVIQRNPGAATPVLDDRAQLQEQQ